MKLTQILRKFPIAIILSVLVLIVCSCRPAEQIPTLLPAKTLPPTWTPEPHSSTIFPQTSAPTQTPTLTLTPAPSLSPAPTLSPTQTLPPTLTPHPGGYLGNTWLIDIERPDIWYSPNHLTHLSDGTILAVGVIYSDQNKFESWTQTSIWIARLTPTGEILWMRYLPLPEDDKFNPSTLHAGLDGSGLLSGAYHHPTGDGRVQVSRMTLSISSEGDIERTIPISSGYKEILIDGSILLQTGIKSAKIINQRAELISQIELDFGSDYGEVWEFPYPELEIAHQLPDGGWVFAGTIMDVYWGKSSSARSGYSEGDVAYWYARFNADGSLTWKHLHPFDPLRQRIQGLMINADHEIVIAGSDQFQSQSHAWLRKIDADGKTIFHKRYLDLPILRNSLAQGVDGSIYIWGRRSIPQGENQPDLNIVSLAKVSSKGDLDWIHTFPNHVYINAVLPLDDNSILVSIRVPGMGITLARIDASGQLPGCTALPFESYESRVDQQPPLFDTADQVPISLLFTTPDAEEVIDFPPITLRSIDLPPRDLCRDLSDH